MMAIMDDFEHFVKGLGPHAKHYTREQLKQLHVEVRKLAEVLLAVHDAKTRARKKASCPQPVLDGADSDRTIEIDITERDDGSKSSRVQDS